ncbi:MDR family MFS transporter [Paenibacillus physcomitrellae]|uniref:MFS-type transporter YqjV n=1 Tax=Paenibacillus physcomitrellae TaxID=1619311 RepID=A0ABQ1FRE7_9BACL|nr:putative MFS-type transporter YqjV [Paenibacillus physcomitrellae]
MIHTLRYIHPLAWTIVIGTMFGRLVTSMSIPFLSIYLTQVLGASSTETGLTVAVSSLAGVLVSFYGGYISDRIGRKKVMLISVFGWACVFFGFAAAREIWVFFVVNTLNGLCRSVFEPASRALLSDVTPKERKLLVFNMRYFAVNLGVVFGPLIGLALGSSRSTFPFVIAGLVYILYGLVIVIQFRIHPVHGSAPERNGSPHMLEALRTTSQDKVFLPILLGTIFCVLGYGHFSSTLAQYVAMSPLFENGSRLFSYMLTLNAVTVLVLQYPLVKTASKFPPVVPLIAGNLCVAGSMLIFGVAGHMPMLLAGVVVFTIGEVLMFTMMDVLIDRIAKPEWRGTYFGTIGFNNIGSVLAPILGGLLLDGAGPSHGLLIFAPLAVTTVFGFPLLLTAHRRLTRREQHEQTPAA